MNIKIKLSMSFVILIFIMTSCVTLTSNNQLDFGIEAAKRGLWDEAMFRWEKVIQTNPNSAAAHNNLAVAYEKKGYFDKAETEYKKALQLSPENKQIQSNYQQFKKIIGKNEKDEKKDEKKQISCF